MGTHGVSRGKGRPISPPPVGTPTRRAAPLLANPGGGAGEEKAGVKERAAGCGPSRTRGPRAGPGLPVSQAMASETLNKRGRRRRGAKRLRKVAVADFRAWLLPGLSAPRAPSSLR